MSRNMSPSSREAQDNLSVGMIVSDFRCGRLTYDDLVGELTPIIGYDDAVETAKEAERARFADETDA